MIWYLLQQRLPGKSSVNLIAKTFLEVRITMKRLFTVLFILLLTGMLSLAMTGCGDGTSPAEEVYSAEAVYSAE